MNPFKELAELNPHHAKTLALAFKVAHNDIDEVHAAIRFARIQGLLPEKDYLQGSFFEGWQAELYYNYGIGDLRKLANAFLDGAE